ARLVLEIETGGNIEALTPPPLPELTGAKIYDLTRVAVKNDDEKTPPVARWEADIVPTIVGTLTVPQISFAYFDPQKRSYQVIKSDSLSLEVSAINSQAASSPDDSSTSIPSIILASRVVRYSFLAVLMAVGLGVAFMLNRRQKPEAVEPQ